MAGIVSLFQKYRSQSFDDLVGQEIVVKTLSNAIKNGTPAHVYLFCGPRGTGKTSTARILAKSLNCAEGPTAQPCNHCPSCLGITDGSDVDLLELDAASNTQVDKVRDLIIDQVQYAPNHSRYKIYIIDEVHMLSTSSFNALLKTLEEPPEHVIFILCTTDPHKLPATVLSRCQRHDFQRFTLNQIAGRVMYVAEKEGMTCTEEAAQLIARAADGSMRDALSELGAVAALSDGCITGENVELALGLSGYDSIRKLVEAMANGDANAALAQLNQVINSGRELKRLANELCEYLRRIMLILAGAATSDSFDIPDDAFQALEAQAKRFSMAKVIGWLSAVMSLQENLAQTSNARILWEMLIIRLTVPGAEDTLQNLSQRIARLEAAVSNGTPLPPLSSVASPVPANRPVSSSSSQPASQSSYQPTSQPASRPDYRQANRPDHQSDARSTAQSTSPTPNSTASRQASQPAPQQQSQSSNDVDNSLQGDNAVAVNASEPSAIPQAATSKAVAPQTVATPAVATTVPVTSAASLTSAPDSNLGWGNVGSRNLSRPAPKKVADNPRASAADRALSANTVSSPKTSVRDSWAVPARSQANAKREPLPEVPVASSAELADLHNLWLGFTKFVDNSELSALVSTLREAEAQSFQNGTLTVSLPPGRTREEDNFISNAPELNKMIARYRSNITKVVVSLGEPGRFATSNKNEQEEIVRQIIAEFGAVEVNS